MNSVQITRVLAAAHDRLASPEERDSHTQGWNDCLDCLPPLLA